MGCRAPPRGSVGSSLSGIVLPRGGVPPASAFVSPRAARRALLPPAPVYGGVFGGTL
uniref:Uncharacterized protein n=1 Tax=uncultured Armatimonadetes bacterium TaxID=157466 RepID=A0A6J4IR21_9BACT|nr:hypothetical protein AVDCRST_MAG63-2292 [uncultured Armatimonadetes bacterium]